MVAILGRVSEDREEKSAINWVQVIAGALAAVSSAVLLSTLGVGGTLLGAAVGSVAASVASAFYSRTLDVSRQQVAVQTAALRRVATARSRLDEAVSKMNRGDAEPDPSLTEADEALVEAEHALESATSQEEDHPGVDEEDDQEAAPDAAETSKRLPWKRVALVAVAVFVAAMVAITAFELLTGRAVSTYTGGSDDETGSTVPGLGNGSSQRQEDQPSQRPSESPSPTESDETTDEPTVEPTQSPDENETPDQSPTEEPTDGDTETPTVVPTPEPTVTPDDGTGSSTP